jgi:two-component system chemotaxis response regulator CheY
MSTIKVALIEDDAAIVQMYTMRFELSGGYDVKVANNGAEGLEVVQSFNPDIILLDMMMPKMSGIETLTRLRKLPGGKKLKIIALTNMKDEDTIAKIRKLKVQDYIVKAELSPSQLEEHIHRALGLALPATH